MAKQGKRFVERRAPLSESEKEIMMAILIRNPAAFEAVAGQLTPQHFSQLDRRFAVLWAAVVDYYDENGDLPPSAHISAEIQRRLENDPDALEMEEIERLDEFLGSFAFNFRMEELNPAYALKRVRQLLEDSVQNRVAELVNEQETPLELGRLLGEFHEEAVNISALSTASSDPFPDNDDDWAPPELNIYTTGVPFLDTFLDGGQSPGETYVVGAPYGTCKTMLSVQLTVGTALYFYDLWVRGGKRGPCPVTYHGSWEEPLSTLRLRAISFAAVIHRHSIWRKEAWATRSTRGHLKPYELEIFSPHEFGEVERMRVYKKILNQCWKPFDMTGADKENPGRGNGGIDEFAALIRADHRQRGKPIIGTTVIDYVQTVADRYVNSARGGDYGDLRHLVGRMPGHAAARIGKPLGTPIWLMSQLNGAANGLSPGKLPKHTDAAEAKNLAENADFAFTIGAKQQDSFALLGATKARRAQLQREIVVHIDGLLNVVRDRSKDMCLDPASRRIVKRGDLRRVVSDNDDEDRLGDEAVMIGNY